MPIINIRLESSADTGGFEKINKAAEVVAEKMGHTMAEVGIGVLGARTATKLLEEEVKRVIEKIDKIPGVPTETIESIQRAKLYMAETRQQVDQWIAQGLTWFTQIGEGLGYLAASVVYGEDATAAAYAATQREADAAAAAAEKAKEVLKEQAAIAKELQENERVLADLHKARAAFTAVGETPGEKLHRLTVEAAAAQYKTDNPAKGATRVEKGAALAESYRAQAEWQKAMLDMSKEETALADKKNAAAFETLTMAQKIASLQTIIAANHDYASRMDERDAVQRERKLEAETAEFNAQQKLKDLLKVAAEEQKKADADALDALEKRAQRLQAERAIAEQRGDKVEANRLLTEERDVLREIVASYEKIASTETTPGAKEAARAKAAEAAKGLTDGKTTTQIGTARDNYNNRNDPANSYQTIGDGAEAGWKNFIVDLGTTANNIAASIRSTLGSAIDGISQGINGLVTGTKSWGQVWSAVGGSVLQSLIKMGVQIVANKVLGTLASNTAKAEGVSSGATIAAANAPAAAAVSIATKGSGAAYGAAAAAIAIATIIALLAKGGFEEGGFTSAGPNDKPAGIVHSNEWIAPAWMVSSGTYGPLISALESGRMGGFFDGGYVASLSRPAYQPAPSFASSPSSPASSSSASSGNIYIVQSEAAARKMILEHGDFDAAVHRANRRNRYRS